MKTVSGTAKLTSLQWVICGIAAIGFLAGVGLTLLIPRRQLGPDGTVTTRAREVGRALIDAVAHLRSQRAAAIGLLTIAAHRLIYGIVLVAMILTRSMPPSPTSGCS